MAIKKQIVADYTEKSTMICLHCESEMQENKFYKSRSKIIDSSKFSLCKNCATRLGNEDIETLHELLMVLNIPFIPEVYKEGLTKESLFSYYMTVLNNPNKKHTNGMVYQKITYVDSPTLEQVVDVDAYIYASDERLSELYSLFGDKWTKEVLLLMNKELDDMIVQYGGKREDMPTMDLYCELIRLKWLAREQMDNKNIKDGKLLLAERNKMLKENSMTVQAMKEKNNTGSFGVEIDYCETRPIKPKKKYFDYSGLMHMFKYFITHQERFNGDNNKPIDDDYEEMIDYKNKHKDYKAEMFEDDYNFDTEDDLDEE